MPAHGWKTSRRRPWARALNQGLVRCERPGATGEAFFSGTTWSGQRAMRVSVVSWRTGAGDVSRTIAAVAGVLADALAGK